MATHECSACLKETIQGATEVDGSLVLPCSDCLAPGGLRHNWLRKSSPTQGNKIIKCVYSFETTVFI